MHASSASLLRPLSRHLLTPLASTTSIPFTYRSFHATPKREIVPFVALGAVALFGRYSYRAVQRMKLEQEEYDDYLLKFGHHDDAATPLVAVLGVDLGTSSVRVAITQEGKPVIVEDREGGRFTPSYVFYEDGGGAVTGNLAAQRVHAGPQKVLSPFDLLTALEAPEHDEEATRATADMLRDVVVNAIDKKAAGSIGAVEGVLSYNPAFTQQQQQALVKAAEMAGLIDPYIVCEAVGAAIAAEHHGIITKEEKLKPVMIVDFGHAVGSFSVVASDKLIATSSTPMAGQLLASVVVDTLTDKFRESDKVDLTTDVLAVQRLYDAAGVAVTELAKKSRVDVDLPFISADAGGAKHLAITISRDVLAQVVDEKVGVILPNQDWGTGVSAVVISQLMETLTSAKITPMDLGAVVVVGGASRHPIYQEAVKKAMGMLGGEEWGNRTLKIVEAEMAAELTVLGVSLSLK